MPLNIGNDIFGLERTGEAKAESKAVETESPSPMEEAVVNALEEKVNGPETVKPKIRSRKSVKNNRKQKASKVSCTFWLEESVRNELQGASYLLSEPQNSIVESAIRDYIKRKGLRIPKKVA